MDYMVTIAGIRSLIMHNGAGIDPTLSQNVERAEITRKWSFIRTEGDHDRLRELKCLLSLWLDPGDRPTIPASAIRANLESAARHFREGPQTSGDPGPLAGDGSRGQLPGLRGLQAVDLPGDAG